MPLLVDVGSVDTYRPKGQTARKLKDDKLVSNIPVSSEGASGEIVDSNNAPILPIKSIGIARTNTC